MAEKGVVIRPSFYEAIISMGEQNQLALFKAICCYGLYGQEPVGLSARAEALFALMKPNLDSASKRYNASVANGKKGGGQTGNQNARKRPRNDQSIQPRDEPNTETEKEKEKETDIETPGAGVRYRKRTFSPPDVQDVDDYCREQGYSCFGGRFVDYYESIGWMVGDKPMRDWRAAARNWNRKAQDMAEDTQDGFVLAPAEDPFEVAVREGRYV